MLLVQSNLHFLFLVPKSIFFVLETRYSAKDRLIQDTNDQSRHPLEGPIEAQANPSTH